MVAHASNYPRERLDMPCVQCGLEYTLYVCPEDMRDWLAGSGYIQNLMPYLSAGERELLISGTCDDCFKKMFDMDDDIE